MRFFAIISLFAAISDLLAAISDLLAAINDLLELDQKYGSEDDCMSTDLPDDETVRQRSGNGPELVHSFLRPPRAPEGHQRAAAAETL